MNLNVKRWFLYVTRENLSDKESPLPCSADKRKTEGHQHRWALHVLGWPKSSFWKTQRTFWPTQYIILLITAVTWGRRCNTHFKNNKTKSLNLKMTKLSLTQMARGVYIQALGGLDPWVCHHLSFMTAKFAHYLRIFIGIFPRNPFSAMNCWLILQQTMGFRSSVIWVKLFSVPECQICSFLSQTLPPHVSFSLKLSLNHTPVFPS